MSNAHLAMFWGEARRSRLKVLSHMMLLEESKLSHIGAGTGRDSFSGRWPYAAPSGLTGEAKVGGSQEKTVGQSTKAGWRIV